MTTRRLTLAILLLLCGFSAGLILTGRMRASSESAAQAPEPARPVGGAASQTVVSTLPDFSAVASRTVPVVANISSQQVVRRPNSPFANDPFYNYFFGDSDDLFGSRRGVQNSLGSGVVVSADGYILTNNHVVAGESGRLSLNQLPAITVALGDQRQLTAQIVGVDPATDLALLKVDARNLPTMPWGDSSKLKVAEWVLAIGNPFQLNQTVTLGIVSAVGRRNIGIAAYEDFIQTDAAINPGNSGGALVSARGELVGINTAIFSQSGGYQGIGFAVPSNLARRVVSELQQYGEVRRGSMGYLEIAPVPPQAAAELGVDGRGGVLIQAMRRDSSAYAAGLRPGDVVVSVNGTPISDGAQFSRLVQDARIGSSAAVSIVRDGRTQTVQVPIRSGTGN